MKDTYACKKREKLFINLHLYMYLYLCIYIFGISDPDNTQRKNSKILISKWIYFVY